LLHLGLRVQAPADAYGSDDTDRNRTDDQRTAQATLQSGYVGLLRHGA
jgi:hypothetical protein